MKYIKLLTILIFFAIIVIPVIYFNFEEDSISAIDNRALAPSPFSAESRASGDLTNNIENYVNDRIGFRDDMILAYTIFNDQLFHEMVHPSYSYGKDGYVFGAGLTVNTNYTDYHESFINMVKSIQDYCEERNIPFLFVFNPAKPAVLTEYIPDGLNYNRSWVDSFIQALEEQNIHYIDTTDLLREKTANGEAVFNQKYDANHWNDLGAYYGVNEILKELQKVLPNVHVISKDELNISETQQTTLLVSEFPIDEMVPNISLSSSINYDMGDFFKNEIKLHPSFQGFGYRKNEQLLTENAPKALVFQGSYMNGYGYKYLENGFGEYIYVHNYQNVIDFPYYYHLFKPDCVIFTVAEYVFSNTYFDQEAMNAIDYNPTLENVLTQYPITAEIEIPKADITVEQGNALTTITWNSTENFHYVWFEMDTVYDMKQTEYGWETTVLTEEYLNHEGPIIITTLSDDIVNEYILN